MFINKEKRELDFKLLYWGAPFSGKSTNLHVVQQRLAPKEEVQDAERPSEEPGRTDRVLWLGPLRMPTGQIRGHALCFHLFAAPGHPSEAAYYQLLRGPDSIVLVIDTQRARHEAVLESLEDLERRLQDKGMTLEKTPHVLQYNKRDLSADVPVEELRAKFNRWGAPEFAAVATQPAGVVESFKQAAKLAVAAFQATVPK